MKVVRTAVTGLLVVVLFASLAALAMASPPSGNPASGCGHGPTDGTAGPPAGQYNGGGPPGGQYGGTPSPPNPPGSQYGPPGGQYGVGGGGGSGGPPDGCPPPGYEYHP